MTPLPPLTDEELAEIRSIAEKATAGPWEVDGRRIVSRRANRAVDLVVGEIFGPSRTFIARSRTDVIRLLDTIAADRAEMGSRNARLEIERLRSDIETIRAQLALATSKERERCVRVMRDVLEDGLVEAGVAPSDARAIAAIAQDHIAQAIESSNG